MCVSKYKIMQTGVKIFHFKYLLMDSELTWTKIGPRWKEILRLLVYGSMKTSIQSMAAVKTSSMGIAKKRTENETSNIAGSLYRSIGLQFWSLYRKKQVAELENSLKSATRSSKELEHNCYDERLKNSGLFSV